ncbi:MAG: acyl-CoA thioesterase [Desulfuromusa sp.]|nr:acyl-CoA thioesterase [Desulfuromusa sp.]
MAKIYSYRFTIPTEANDENGHVNNVAYVQWMQDVATMHSDAQGCSRELYRSLNSSWLVRSHHIEYLRPAFAGDEIEIQTWVCNLKRASSLRRYLFLNTSNQSVLARAETDWVYVSADTGRPRRIDPEVSKAFILVPLEEEP